MKRHITFGFFLAFALSAPAVTAELEGSCDLFVNSKLYSFPCRWMIGETGTTSVDNFDREVRYIVGDGSPVNSPYLVNGGWSRIASTSKKYSDCIELGAKKICLRVF